MSPFGTKIGYIRDKILGEDLVPMANYTVTYLPHCLLFSNDPKSERIGEAHLTYYARAYNRVETNQPPQDLFISSM